MYTRISKIPEQKSFFLFGPRGTGKTTFLRTALPHALYFDLLNAETHRKLLNHPVELNRMIPRSWSEWVVLDEVQRIPQILYEVHRLIESRHVKFAITCSSARKLRRGDTDMLAGRALTRSMFPLTAEELGEDFSLPHALSYGHLPSTFDQSNPKDYLASYVATYLREEVQQEGLTRNLGAFSRFLEAASFSQAQPLNISAVARECMVERKVAESYFTILEDLLIAVRIPVFRKKAKREVVAHRKFFFFDAGVYRAIRPKGPLDTSNDIDGASLETLVFQELSAANHYHDLGYSISFWRTRWGHEVDFVLYGERGLVAIEVKRSDTAGGNTLRGLHAFREDYPIARTYLLHAGTRDGWENDIRVLPVETFLKNIVSELSQTS